MPFEGCLAFRYALPITHTSLFPDSLQGWVMGLWLPYASRKKSRGYLLLPTPHLSGTVFTICDKYTRWQTEN